MAASLTDFSNGLAAAVEKGGLIFTIVDAGPHCVDMIAKLRRQEKVGGLDISDDFLARIAAAADPDGGQSKSSKKDSQDRAAKSLLTDTEREIVALVAKGLANKQIANVLSIGVGTVKWHLHNIYGKLNAPSRRNVADIARRQGLL